MKPNKEGDLTNAYSEFLIIFKDNTLADLHKSILLQLELSSLEHFELYVMHPYTNNKIYIPNDPYTTLRRFILNHNITAVFYSNPPAENNNQIIPPVYFIYIEFTNHNTA